MNLPHFLVLALAAGAKARYILIFFGVWIEGPIIMITSGFLLHKHLLDIFPLFAALVLGDLAGDITWYCLGRFVAEPIIRKKGTFLGVSEEMFDRGKKLFHRYHERILWVSKLTLGFGLAVVVLMVAGATKVSFKKYMLINFCGELILVGILLSLGYFFGNIYSEISTRYQVLFLVLVGLAIVGILYGLGKVMRKKAMKLSE